MKIVQQATLFAVNYPEIFVTDTTKRRKTTWLQKKNNYHNINWEYNSHNVSLLKKIQKLFSTTERLSKVYIHARSTC